MPTWNCHTCDMPMTLADNIPNLICPNWDKIGFQLKIRIIPKIVTHLKKKSIFPMLNYSSKS